MFMDRRFSIIRMAMFPELIYKFDAIQTFFSQNFHRVKSIAILEKRGKKNEKKRRGGKEGLLTLPDIQANCNKTM